MPHSFSSHALYLAPLRGVTDHLFRTLYEKHFGQFDFMLAPFIPTTRGTHVRLAHFHDILPEKSDTSRLIPQVIGNEAEGFLLLCRRFSDLGYNNVNWNLGCPAPLITRKKRGSGLLPYTDEIIRFLEEVIPRISQSISVKVRLGLETPSDLERLLPRLNALPLSEVIIHPRTGRQLYSGTVDLETFSACAALCDHPVVYNGDIISVSDLQRLSERFPGISRWMIGRGIVCDPLLLPALRGETVNSPLARLRAFHDEMFKESSASVAGPLFLLGKMKELWRYWGPRLDTHGDITSRILKIASIADYTDEVNRFFELYEDSAAAKAKEQRSPCGA